ncbi:MAG: glycosyltransferase [Desulfovibrio sp.]|jgi:glycosyltransferase involved in cell wall biosynthesis|nr:glycosyltransferase [Desulfovibrio sp.]
MRIYYHLSDYVSHRITGMEYVACLRALGHEVSHEAAAIEQADVAIIHDEPWIYAGLLARYPGLGRVRRVACCVWESDALPPAYAEALRLVNEVWTPSRFSLQIIAPHCASASVLPHVVRRIPPTRAAMVFASEALAPAQGAFRFFSIVDAANPRKNAEALIAAFRAVAGISRRPVALVLKQYRRVLDFSAVPGIISIDGECSAEEIAALHSLCDAYVSAHHAEGWGLGLSEAMAWGKPVIATGWSGNMEFMNEDNSFPVPYTVSPVSKRMCEAHPRWTTDMRWAEVDRQALVAVMGRVAEGRVPVSLPAKAAAITDRFGPETVSLRLEALLGKR